MHLSPTLLAALLLLGTAAACRDGGGGKTGAPAAARTPEVDEVEPNDEPEKAQSISSTVIVRGSSSSGAVPDADYYKVLADPRVVVRLELSEAAGVDAVLEVFDVDRRRLVRADAAQEGGAEQVPNVTCEVACYVKVSATKKGADARYRLGFVLTRPHARSEREPNDRADDAQLVGLGAPVDAYLSPAEEADWYLLSTAELAPGAVISVDLLPPKELRLELSVVRHSDRARLVTWRAAGPGEPLRVRNLSRPPEPETGYFLVVRSAPVAEPGGKAQRRGDPSAPYTLEVRSAPGLEALETEPNDDPERASPLPPETPRAVGFLAPVGDVDWYRYTVPAPSILRAELGGVEDLDLALAVVDPTAPPEGRKGKAGLPPDLVRMNDGAVGQGETVVGLVVPAGELLLRVESAARAADAPGLAGANANTPYSLSVAFEADDGTFEREPNDRAENATPVSLGRAYRGYIHPSRDVDLYRLEIERPGNVVLTLGGVPRLDLSILVRDTSSRDEKGAFPVIGSVDKNRVEGDERLVVPFEPGSYLVEIRAQGDAANPAQAYTLTLR